MKFSRQFTENPLKAFTLRQTCRSTALILFRGCRKRVFQSMFCTRTLMMASTVRRMRGAAAATRLLLSHRRRSPSSLPIVSSFADAPPPRLLKQHPEGSAVLRRSNDGRVRVLGDVSGRQDGRLIRPGGNAGRTYWAEQGDGGRRRSSSSSEKSESDGEAIASQMIGYAAGNRKNVATHVEVSRVLEQGYTFLLSQGPSTANAAAKVLLTLATFHVDGGKLLDAVDVLQQAANLEGASAEVGVSASQALVGVFLRLHKDSDALSQAQSTVELVNEAHGLPLELAQELKFRAAATVQFVEHATSTKTSGTLLDMSGLSSWLNDKEAHLDGVAAALLGIAESAHIRGHFSQAKDLYEKASALAESSLGKEAFGFSAGAMSADEVLVGAVAGLGQVAAHLGDFDDAEKELTKALTHAEQINGEKHPRVGAVLACLADVYAQRGVVKGSGDLTLTEGLYRRATDLLRAPPLDSPASEEVVDLSDVIAISRARYAALLSHTNKRESEAHKLQAWATAAWKGTRSLEDVLTQEASTQPTTNSIENDEAIEDAYSGRYVVIDIRIGRVLYSPSSV